MSMKKYILGAGIFLLALFGINQYQDISIGSDAVTPIAGQTYTLSGSGVSSSDTSITLTSFTITQTGYEIQDSDMSEVFYLTIEPGSRSRQEIVSCTTVTQNGDNTATLSGCERGLMPFSPYSSSTQYAFAHSGGSTVIFSNPPQLYNQTAFKDNDEIVTGSWLFPTPLGDFNPATKQYVDSLVTGGVVSNDRLIVAATAGETLATGTLVYFRGVDQEWYRVDTDDTTTFQDRFVGLTQGAGVNAGAISGGVLLKGRHTLSSGFTAGAVYYASTSAGTISSTTSALPIGVADDTNILYFDPVVIGLARTGMNNTFTGTNILATTTISNLSVTDISGAVSKIVASSSVQLFQATTSENVFTTNVVGGSLGTDNVIRFRVNIDEIDLNGVGRTVTFDLNYGSTTIASTTITAGGTHTDLRGTIEGLIYANNSASSQFAVMNTDLSQNKATTGDYGSETGVIFAKTQSKGFASENSSQNKQLTLTTRYSNGGNGTVIAGYVVELIQ